MCSGSYYALTFYLGIKLTLNLEVDEYVKNFASGYGVRVVIHEPGTFPLPAEEGMTLSPGYETSIGLKAVGGVNIQNGIVDLYRLGIKSC